MPTNVTFPGNLGQVDTIVDLRDLPSTFIDPGTIYVVKTIGRAYSYDPGSLAADDGLNVIRPNDRTPLQAGRFLYEVDGIAPGPKGEPGAADNTYSDLTLFKASPLNRKIARMVGVAGFNDGDFYWTPGDYSTEVINQPGLYVASSLVPASTGAWVRQTDASLTFQNPLGGPAIRRLLRDRNGETVKVTDYCNNAGGSDHENYQELLDLRPAEIVYPRDFNVLLEGQIRLRSNMRHNMIQGSAILADVPDFGMFALGESSGNLGVVQAPIVRFTKDMQLNNTSGEPLTYGDMLLIADVTDPANIVNEVQVIQVVNGTLLRMQDKFNVSMANPANIRVYKVYAPVENVSFDGRGRISNVNPMGGGGVRLNLTRGFRFRKTMLDEIRYIGLAIENTIGFGASGIDMRDIEASGIGMRVAKRLNFSDITAIDIKSDEAFTAFDNVLGCNVANLIVHQYLFGDDPEGGTAGNNVLLDKLCADFNFVNLILRGSATYNFFVNDRSENISVENFQFGLSNLGGARVANNCRNVKFGSGSVEDVINNVHPASGFGQASGQPCAGIMIDPNSFGCGVSGIVDFERIASGRTLMDRQAVADRPTARVPRLAAGVETPVHAVTARETLGAVSADFAQGTAGRLVTVGADANSVWMQARSAGDTANAPLNLNPFGGTVKHTPPAYASNSDAAAAGLTPGEWYRNTTSNAVTVVV